METSRLWSKDSLQLTGQTSLIPFQSHRAACKLQKGKCLPSPCLLQPSPAQPQMPPAPGQGRQLQGWVRLLLTRQRRLLVGHPWRAGGAETAVGPQAGLGTLLPRTCRLWSQLPGCKHAALAGEDILSNAHGTLSVCSMDQAGRCCRKGGSELLAARVKSRCRFQGPILTSRRHWSHPLQLASGCADADGCKMVETRHRTA